MWSGKDVTEEQKTLISRLLRQNKCTQREMAEVFHVSQHTVANIARKLPSEKWYLESISIWCLNHFINIISIWRSISIQSCPWFWILFDIKISFFLFLKTGFSKLVLNVYRQSIQGVNVIHLKCQKISIEK